MLVITCSSKLSKTSLSNSLVWKSPLLMLSPSLKVKETANRIVKLSLNPYINMVVWSSKIPESTNRKMLNSLTWWRNILPKELLISIRGDKLLIFIPITTSKLVPLLNTLKRPELMKNLSKVTNLRIKLSLQFPHHLMLNGDISGTLVIQLMPLPTKSQLISLNGHQLWTDGVIIWLMDAILLLKWPLWD